MPCARDAGSTGETTIIHHPSDGSMPYLDGYSPFFKGKRYILPFKYSMEPFNKCCSENEGRRRGKRRRKDAKPGYHGSAHTLGGPSAPCRQRLPSRRPGFKHIRASTEDKCPHTPLAGIFEQTPRGVLSSSSVHRNKCHIIFDMETMAQSHACTDFSVCCIERRNII